MQVIRFPNAVGRFDALHFGPDGRTLAAVFRAEVFTIAVRWWDIHKQKEVAAEPGAVILEDDFTPPAPALSPDHRFLARMANEYGGVQHLQLIDRSANRPKVRPLTAWEYKDEGGASESHNFQNFQSLTFTPDGRFLLALAAGGDPDDDALDADRVGVYRWDVAAVLRGRGPKSGGRLLPDPDFFLPTPQPDVVGWSVFGHRLAVAPDGSALAAGDWNARILGWELPSRRPLPTPKLKKRRLPVAWRLAFSPDARTLAAADETVTLYDVKTAAPRAALPPGPVVSVHPMQPTRRTVFDLAFDPSGRVLATAHGDPLVRCWDAATGAERATFEWDVGGVTVVAFSPDGCLCAAGGTDGLVAVWDANW